MTATIQNDTIAPGFDSTDQLKYFLGCHLWNSDCKRNLPGGFHAANAPRRNGPARQLYNLESYSRVPPRMICSTPSKILERSSIWPYSLNRPNHYRRTDSEGRRTRD